MKHTLRILSLEDNPMDAELVQATLRVEWPDCEVVCVETREAFRAALAQGGFDLILSDNTLPTFAGREALLIARTEHPEVPFIYVSGTIGEEAAIESLREGALDYVLKHRLAALVPAVRRALREAEDRAARREAEEALRRREEHFRSLTENALDLVTILGPDAGIRYESPSVQRVLGYTPEELVGRCAFELVHPDDLPSVQAAFGEAVQDPGKAVTVEFRFRHQDGTWRDLEAIGKSLLQTPEVAGVVINSREVSQRKRAEQRIREQAELLDKARDAILVCDMERRILYWNDSAERLYGWTAEEAMGREVAELLFATPTENLAAMEQRLLEKGEWMGEVTQRTKSGGSITVESHLTLVRDEAGRPKAKLVINTDITGKKELEAQFLRAQRLESIGMLASGIAHDLNNVLAPIMMAVSLLRDQLKEGSGAEILNTLDASAQRGASLVQQILSFARGREGQRQALQLGHLIAEFAKVIRDTFPKSIHFHRQVAADLWRVEANPTQMHQVLLNLCVNARDAMPRGGRLTVTAKNIHVDELKGEALSSLAPGDYVYLQVADTGTGIPPDIRDKIFLPFFTTKAEGHGTGLGLASVLGIVKNHGGLLTVDSMVDQGTTFSVYLPAATATASAATKEVAPALARGNGETILMAEDERGVRDVMVKSLSRQGYRVLAASDGAEAMALFAQNAADIKLVLTDVNMPYMDGAAFIRAIRKLDPEMRILVMTGLADNFDSVRFSSGRPIPVLRKPFDSRSLLGAVHEALHHPPEVVSN